ncbi:MAG: glycosyltransferase [Bacteroidales bacterium]|nr:glycosyltransferase [Bacteroidales bacterium]
MPTFSIIIPVYNRPQEMAELLESLAKQTLLDFEVIIVEDGSTQKSKDLANKYTNIFSVTYHFKSNTGQSDSRNIGAKMAKGEYLVFFDSDCIIPENYFQTVKDELNKRNIDCWGGPDAAHESFTDIQKAINHSMTSFFTTGGIRGGKKPVEKFCPRSFNMGIAKYAFNKVNGFRDTLGEDIDISLRLREAGFNTNLIHKAFVYHKRRVDIKKFFKQVHIFGQARIALYKQHPGSLKLVHFAPALFTLFLICMLILSVKYPWVLILLAAYLITLFADSSYKNKSIKIGLISVLTGLIQLVGYGTGFIKAFWNKIILGKPLDTRKKIKNMYNKEN